MGTRALRGPFAVALLGALLHAQARAPFTGTVCDEAGKPLANAEVTCVFVPDFGALGELDRVTTKSDDGGRFRMQLLVGSSYTVWAIGPAGDRGVRSVVWPRPDGAGGKTLDLMADERREPAKLQVTGISPWMADGPLSLRVFIAGSCPVGDMIIPGDGTVHLPPLPVAQIRIALLDGKGITIDAVRCDLEVTNSITFGEPTEVAFAAQDGDGKPLAGVQVIERRFGVGSQTFDRLADQYVSRVTPLRVIGVTGATGSGVGRVAGEPGLLCGRLPGHADSWSGWMRVPMPRAEAATVSRVHDGKQAADDGAVIFVLRPTELRSLRVVGLAERERADVWFRGESPYRFRNGAGVIQYLLPPAPTDGAAAADGAAVGTDAFANVRLVSDSPVPRRLAVLRHGAGQLEDLDLAKLRRFSLSTVDVNGRAAPGIHVGIAPAPDSYLVSWSARFVTDAEGHGELLTDDRFDWFVYATSGTASAGCVIAKTDAPGTLILKLEALPTLRLLVTDGDGRPIRGARLEYGGGGLGAKSADAVGKGLDAVASSGNSTMLSLLRSNAAGELIIPFVERVGVGTHFKVVSGSRKSGDLMLQSAAETRRIVLE
jgi:hypothetical protein